jgi:hypothetical protein
VLLVARPESPCRPSAKQEVLQDRPAKGTLTPRIKWTCQPTRGDVHDRRLPLGGGFPQALPTPSVSRLVRPKWEQERREMPATSGRV